jgi:PAS domain S-box-containing protein
MNTSNINPFHAQPRFIMSKAFGAQNPLLLIIYAVIAFIWLLISVEVAIRIFSTTFSDQTRQILEYLLLPGLLCSAMIILYRHFHKVLIAREEQYDQLFKMSPQPMWIYDVQTQKILRVNEAAKTLYGYSEQEFLALTIHDIRMQDDVPAIIDSVEDENKLHVDSSYHWAGTWRHKKKSGGLVYVEISSHGIAYEGKRAELVLSYDVTDKVNKDLELQTLNQELERKILQRTNDLLYLNKTLIDQNKTIKCANLELVTVGNQLQEANKKIKEHSELKNKFISMVSHEFRTPLASINFAAGFIKRYHEKIKTESLLEKVQSIEKHVAHMNALLSDVLTIGNNDSAKIQVNYQTLDLNNFIQKIIQEVECANQNSHTVNLSLYGMLPDVLRTDEKLLRNIFINLLNNGIKYSPGHNSIDFVIYGNESELVFEIKDHGVGISAPDLEKIFEPFYRINNGVNIDGTGLGLSIVKRAAELIGARIIVESEVGKGSMFGVILPVQ